MQCACAIFSLWPDPLYLIFHFISQTARFSKKKNYWTQNVFWFSLQRLSEIFFIFRRIERDMTVNVYWCSCKVPVILVQFALNLNFLNRFSKNPSISNFLRIRPVGAELYGRTDRRTDERKDGHVTKLIVVFRKFANAPKNASLKFEIIRYSLSCVVTFFTASRQIRTVPFHVVFNSFTHRPPIWSHYAELRTSSYKIYIYIYIYSLHE
jgi:hypothetical protein